MVAIHPAPRPLGPTGDLNHTKSNPPVTSLLLIQRIVCTQPSSSDVWVCMRVLAQAADRIGCASAPQSVGCDGSAFLAPGAKSLAHWSGE